MKTIAYKYRILRVVSDESKVIDEIRAGHRLYNDLVSIERKRRDDTRMYWAKRGGYESLLDELEASIEEAKKHKKGGTDQQKDARRESWSLVDAKREELWRLERAAIKAHDESDPAKTRRKERAMEIRESAKADGRKLTPKEVAAILDDEPACLTARDKLRKQIEQEYIERGVAVSAKVMAGRLRSAFPGPTEDIEEAARAAAYAAYRDRGVTPGTRAVIAEAHKRSLQKLGAREQRFKPWDGHGTFGAQVQGGVNVDAIYSGSHTVVQLERLENRAPKNQAAMQSGSRRDNRLHLLRVRIGSDDDRRPVWAEFEAILHRPLPPEAVVTQVRVTVDRVGLHDQWHLVLTAQVPDPAYDRQAKPVSKVVAVDIGWRSTEGNLRVGYYVDDLGHHESIELPSIRKRDGKRYTAREAAKHARGVQSLLSKLFCNESVERGGILHELAGWLDLRGRDNVPEWLAEDTADIRRWRSQPRLNRLVERWMGDRFEGDADIVAKLDEWRKRYRHLHEWEARERKRALEVRDEHYRQVALCLARNYETIVINGADLAAMRRRKTKVQAAPDLVMVEDAKRSQAFDAAPGFLREEIVRAAAKYGRTVIKAPFETTPCYVCRKSCEFDRARHLAHECEHCGTTWDQDENACRNALRKWSA